MADASGPITSPPSQPWQPYDATDSGASEDQVAATTIYEPVSGDAGGGPWRKIQDGGASSPEGVAQAGAWPANGSSTDGGWKQT